MDPQLPSLWTFTLVLSIIFGYFSLIGDSVILPLPTSIGESFEFDLQITVPYTIILPAFIGRKRRRRNSQNVGEDEEKDYQAYSENLFSNLDTSSKQGIVYARLYSLFSWMGLEDGECQKRLLCLLSQDPRRYSPLSDIVFQHLDPRRDYFTVMNDDDFFSGFHGRSNWQYFEFYEAEMKGMSPGTNCTHETMRCNVNPDDVINWNVIKAFRAIKDFVNLRFK